MAGNLTPTTELEAVNLMLGAIDAAPVNSLSGDNDLDVVQALAILRQVNREVQSIGWHFNTDRRYPLARNLAGNIVVPANILSIDTSSDYQDRDLSQRAGKMWDKANLSFTFTEDLTFDVTWFFEFTDIPETARNYIALRAARRFQNRRLGSDSLGNFTEKDEMEAYMIFKSAEGIEADYSILDGDPTARMVVNRERHLW